MAVNTIQSMKIKGGTLGVFRPNRGGYIVTIGGYSAPLKEHRENTAKWDSSNWFHLFASVSPIIILKNNNKNMTDFCT